jgi:cysteine desulfurase
VIYLDHNATTPVHPEVRRVLLECLDEAWANPSSGYSPARRSRAALDAARIEVAGLLGATPEEIVFTSGGTESVNTAIASAVHLHPAKPLVLISSVEHSACERAAIDAAGEPQVLRLRVDHDGRYDLGQLADILATHAPQIAIASLMWANNETGVLPGIEAAAELITDAGVLLHTDAVQAAGKVPVDLCSLPADYLSISGHKIFAPKGVGALFVRAGAPFHPLIHGGGQEHSRRSGTEPVALAAALGAASRLVDAKLATGELDTLRHRRDHFEQCLLDLPGAQRNGHPEHRTPNTCNLRFEDVSASLALVLLDEFGICCSSGSACKARSGQASHVLLAMGRNEQEARSSFRFSLSVDTTEAELDQAVDHIAETVTRVRAATTAEA